MSTLSSKGAAVASIRRVGLPFVGFSGNTAATAGMALTAIIAAITTTTARTKRMRLIMHHLLCRATPSGSLLVRPYPYIRGRYMGNKRHVLHRLFSRLSPRSVSDRYYYHGLVLRTPNPCRNSRASGGVVFDGVAVIVS